MYLNLEVFLDDVFPGSFCLIFWWIDIAIVSLIYQVFKLFKAEFSIVEEVNHSQ